jgi:hypothetical protein
MSAMAVDSTVRLPPMEAYFEVEDLHWEKPLRVLSTATSCSIGYKSHSSAPLSLRRAARDCASLR